MTSRVTGDDAMPEHDLSPDESAAGDGAEAVDPGDAASRADAPTEPGTRADVTSADSPSAESLTPAASATQPSVQERSTREPTFKEPTFDDSAVEHSTSDESMSDEQAPEAPSSAGADHERLPDLREAELSEKAREAITSWVKQRGAALRRMAPKALVLGMGAAVIAASVLGGKLVGGLAANVGGELFVHLIEAAWRRASHQDGPVTEERLREVLLELLEANTAPDAARGQETLDAVFALLTRVDGVTAAMEAAYTTDIPKLSAWIGEAVRLQSETVSGLASLREDIDRKFVEIQTRLDDRIRTERRVLRTQQLMFDRVVATDIYIRQVMQRPPPPEHEPIAPHGGPIRPASPYPGLLPFSTADAPYFFGRQGLVRRLKEELAKRLLDKEPSPLLVIGASGAGKTSLLRAGLLPALLTDPTLGAGTWPRVMLQPGARPVVGFVDALVAALTELGDMDDPAPVREAIDAGPQSIADIVRKVVLHHERVMEHEHDRLRAPAGGAAGYDAASRTRLVLIIDQFEELFTQVDEADLSTTEYQRLGEVRRQFVSAVCASATHAGALVVIGLRAGFVGHCTAHPELLAALSRPIIVGPMSRGELTNAIVEPARRVGVAVAPELPGLMLDDLGATGGQPTASPSDDTDAGDDDASPDIAETYDPGLLPLLANALRETWDERAEGPLTVEGYEATGGIRGALAKKADDVLNTCADDHERELLRILLVHLVSVRADTEDTRRRVDRDVLLDEVPESDRALAADLLGRLLHERLVIESGGRPEADEPPPADETNSASDPKEGDAQPPDVPSVSSRPTVEIAHEALLRHWPQLAVWLSKDRDWLRIRQRLVEHAREWREGNSAEYGEAELAAVDSRPDRAGELGATERAFLTASRLSVRRRRRRRRAVISALTAAVLLIGGSLGLTLRALDDAGHSRQQAQAGQLATEADALRGDNPEASLLLSLESYRVARTTASRSSLLSMQSDYPLVIWPTGQGPANALAYDPALPGELAIADQDDGVTLTAPATGASAGEASAGSAAIGSGRQVKLATRAPVYALAFAPDGSSLAAATRDGTVVEWRLGRHAGATLATPTGAPLTFGVGQDAVDTVAYSPDGGTLATAGDDGTVSLWRAADPGTRPLRGLRVGDGPVDAIAFGPHVSDGTPGVAGELAAACADGTVRVWRDPVHAASSAPSEQMYGAEGPVRALAFNPAGTLLAAGGDDDTIRLWRANGPSAGQLAATIGGPTAPVRSVTFSPDGTLLAGGGDDASVRLWHLTGNTATGGVGVFAAGAYAGPTDSVADLAFAPDGATIASADADASIAVWQVATATSGAAIGTVALSGATRGPELAATAGVARGVALWTPDGGADLVRPSAGKADTAASVALDADGELLALPSHDGVVVWNTKKRRAEATYTGTAAPVSVVAISPDGDLVAAGAGDDLYLWSRDQPSQPTQEVAQLGAINAIAFSADGRSVATGSDDKTIAVSKITTTRGTPPKVGVPEVLTGHSGSVDTLAFDPRDGELVSGSSDHTVRLWSPRDATQLGVLTDSARGIVGVAVSGDGEFLASSATDDTVRLYRFDAHGIPRLFATLSGLPGAGQVSFSAHDDTLVTGADNGPALFYTTDPDAVAAKLCHESAGLRAIAKTQLAPYQAGITYRDVCPR
jgi:WD40 repeat protein